MAYRVAAAGVCLDASVLAAATLFFVTKKARRGPRSARRHQDSALREAHKSLLCALRGPRLAFFVIKCSASCFPKGDAFGIDRSARLDLAQESEGHRAQGVKFPPLFVRVMMGIAARHPSFAYGSGH